MNERDRGNHLTSGETVLWRGSPRAGAVARHVFHLRAVGLYFAALFALDGAEAWRKGMALGRAVHDSVPLAAIALVALAIVGTLALLTARATRYTITDRRVVLHYGIALPATLSLPYAQIASVAVAVRRDHGGDLALVLKPGNRMPVLKLWPLARPWRIAAPQPMLRCVPCAAVVGGLLVRALHAAEQERGPERRAREVEAAPALLSA